ncbi:MFS transporter [Microbacterium esteraromaticum]|uniref:MFS transporter n=1 Tax=Microbacterium esteraromaticum TaxID=57043 RepID=UPI00195786A0|nr:CP family cyanate transporter-like MFS transporter [Microbacterium esteraromaticum]
MSAPLPLWRGRVLAVLGILLCAFSLRSAVASLSPVVDLIGEDFAVSSAVLGVIGTLPPACFAVFGILTPMLERMLGIERLTVIALTAITAGLVGRGFAADSIGLLIGTAVIFAGVGMANILLPPLVKKYFADRIGVMMTVYTATMAFSTFVPPLVAVPVADALGWRFSLGMWAAFALAGVVPWLVMLFRPGPPTRPDASESSSRVRETASDAPVFTATGPIATAPTNRRLFARLARIPLVWALALTFATSSTMAYVSFAWLPSIMIDTAGVDAATAGFMLSLWAFIGFPAGLIVPVLVVRFQATRPLFIVGVVGALVGLLGLLLFPRPELLWLWMTLFGLIGLAFPLALVLISIRTRTPESAVLLSSFVQSAGYVLAAIFPLLVGVLHDATGGWTIPIIAVAAVLVLTFPAGIMAGRRVTVEDEWERRHGRW